METPTTGDGAGAALRDWVLAFRAQPEAASASSEMAGIPTREKRCINVPFRRNREARIPYTYAPGV